MNFRAKVLLGHSTIEVRDIEAVDEAEVHRIVAAGGASVLSIERQRSRGKPATRGFNLGVFNQQLCALLDAGQPVVDALEILRNNDHRGRHRGVFDTMLQALRDGKQLSAAMAALPSVFPPLFVAMVQSSETTGTVRTSVRRYMHYQKQVDEIRGKLVAAAVYPAVLLSVGALVVAFLMLYVVPRFSAVFEDAGSRVGAAGFVQVWGGFVRHHPWLAWGGVLAFCAILAAVLAHPGWRARMLMRVLAIGWVGEQFRILQLARLYRTLGMLLRSGVSALNAMRMTGDALPVTLRPSMEGAVAAVAQGIPMSRAFASAGLATEVSTRLLVAGESSGNLDEMMERIADFYDQVLGTLIDTLGRLIEPALMIGIGLVIGAVVLMLYMPIFDLTNVL